MTIIGIQSGLEEISNYIRSHNKYELVNLEEYKGGINAIIYNNKIPNEKYEEDQFKLENNSLTCHGETSHGVLMINASNKSPNDVFKILEEYF